MKDYTLLGLPDSYFEDKDAFIKLAQALDDGADVAVGVFKVEPEQRDHLGMCQIELVEHPLGFPVSTKIVAVVDKPHETNLCWAWGVLGWKPEFWPLIQASDPHVGFAVQRAIEFALDVRAVPMEGRYWDCGTPQRYFDLISHLNRRVDDSE